MQHELFFLHRTAQFVLECQLPGDTGVHLRRVKHVALPRFPRVVERGFGIPDQDFRLGPVRGVDGDTRPDCETQLAAASVERLSRNAPHDLLEHARDDPRFRGAVRGDRELVTAEVRQEVGAVDDALEPPRNSPQQFITGLPAERVVKEPEPFDVEHHH